MAVDTTVDGANYETRPGLFFGDFFYFSEKLFEAKNKSKNHVRYDGESFCHRQSSSNTGTVQVSFYGRSFTTVVPNWWSADHQLSVDSSQAVPNAKNFFYGYQFFNMKIKNKFKFKKNE